MGYFEPFGVGTGTTILPYNYVVYIAGTTIKAIDSSTGTVVTSGTYIDDVVETLLALTTYGCRIAIGPGSFIANDSIDTGDKQLILDGCGQGPNYTSYGITTIRPKSGFPASYVFNVGDDNTGVLGSSIRNLCIAGRQYTTPLGAVYWNNQSLGLIENVIISDFFGTATPAVGILLNEVNAQGCYYNIFKNVDLRRCTIGYNFKNVCNANTIIGGHIANSRAITTYGVYIQGADTLTMLGSTDIETFSDPASIGLYIESGFACNFLGTRFEGNYKNIVIDGGGGTGAHTFVGNSMSNLVGGGTSVTDNGNTHSIFLNCSGYKTKNLGTSTGTGAQQTISHGLGRTPNAVVLTPTATGATETSLTAASDATNFYPTVTNLKTYQWLAEYA